MSSFTSEMERWRDKPWMRPTQYSTTTNEPGESGAASGQPGEPEKARTQADLDQLIERYDREAGRDMEAARMADPNPIDYTRGPSDDELDINEHDYTDYDAEPEEYQPKPATSMQEPPGQPPRPPDEMAAYQGDEPRPNPRTRPTPKRPPAFTQPQQPSIEFSAILKSHMGPMVCITIANHLGESMPLSMTPDYIDRLREALYQWAATARLNKI